jgi:hypothetical protein
MGSTLFLAKDLCSLSHHTTRQTMSLGDVGLTICLVGTSNSMVTLTLWFLMQTEVVPGRVQQPITNFTGPWDDFMVHGVNNPLTRVSGMLLSETSPQGAI